MKLNLISVITIFMVLHQSSAQTTRFIARVDEYKLGDFFGNRTFRCYGSIFTDMHVLTTASCATVAPGNGLAIRVEFSDSISSGSSSSPAQRAFIHPDYVPSDRLKNNIAVVLLDGTFNQATFPPSSLHELTLNSTCDLFGWGGASLLPRRVSVTTYSPEFCDPNAPQAFCSFFDTLNDPTCAANEGSPLVCGAHGIYGFLINNRTCEDNADRNLLFYHSVADFTDWIELVSGAETLKKSSILLLLSAIVISVKGLMR